MDTFFVIPVYKQRVKVSLCSYDDPTLGITRRDGCYGYEVELSDSATPGVIAHECFHVAMLLFHDIGERALQTDGHNEPFAYLLTEIVDQVTKVFEYLKSDDYIKDHTIPDDVDMEGIY